MNNNLQISPENKSFIYTRWVLQICLWVSIIIPIGLPSDYQIILYCLLTNFLFWAYFVFQMISFLYNHGCCSCYYDNQDITIREKMEHLLKYPPRIKWNIKCYHYETEYNTKIITHDACETMSFYSSRDISGTLKINFRELGVNRFGSINLFITPKIEFCDDLTQKDYENQKNAFINAHKDEDEKYEFTEIREIPELVEYYRLKINEGIPNCCAHFCLTFITFGEFYNYYIGYYPRYNNVKVNYKFKKIISTRENLNSPKYNQIYQQSNPKIELDSLQYNYEPSTFIHLNENYNRTIAYKEESEKINTGINSDEEDKSGERL